MESPIVDWEYYSSLHSKVVADDFETAELLAEKEVKRIVGFPRWNALDSEEFYYEQLKDCICNVIDKMAEMKESGAGTGLSSVNNDGYSESYTVQTQSQATAELQSCIRAWLSGTGLAGAY
jgi:hypothetical protein